jgi:hypothetical protein
LRAAAFVASLALVGCSLLVGGEPVPLRCSQEGLVGPPACDDGLECRAGICQAAGTPPVVADSASGEGGGGGGGPD